MPARRFPSEFRAIGAIRADRLGLSAVRAAELELVRVWRRVAGGLADRFPPRVHRGCLVIELPDATWERAIGPYVPALAARLAAELPTLGLRRFRVDVPGRRGTATAVDPSAAEAAAPPAGAEEQRDAPPSVRVEDVDRPASPDGDASDEGDLIARVARLGESYQRAVRERGRGRGRT
jgi:hypothetical protein